MPPSSGPRRTPGLNGSDLVYAHASCEGILSDDGLVALGTGGDDGDRNANQCLQALEIRARIGRQLLIARDANTAFLPPGMLFVHRLAFAEVLGQQRRREHGFTVDLISHANTDRIQTVE